MKKLLFLSLAVLLTGCASQKYYKNATMNYNHITGKNEGSQCMKGQFLISDFYTEFDDELCLRLNLAYNIESIRPVNFCYPYQIKIKGREAYFYCPNMSEYMQDNEWFYFEVTYFEKINIK